MRSFLHSIRNFSFRKPEETFFFYTSRPNWTQEIAADSWAISQPWLTTNMRRSKRIHNSAGAAAQPRLMQNYHKALVLFSKAQQLDFLFSAFFSLLARELMPTAESVVGCKLFKRESTQTHYKTQGSFHNTEFQLTHQKLFHWTVVFFVLFKNSTALSCNWNGCA